MVKHSETMISRLKSSQCHNQALSFDYYAFGMRQQLLKILLATNHPGKGCVHHHWKSPSYLYGLQHDQFRTWPTAPRQSTTPAEENFTVISVRANQSQAT